MTGDSATYKTSGVDMEQQDRSMTKLADWVSRTFGNRPGEVILPLGYFANVLSLGGNLGLAVGTDGVGTKIIVAQLLHKYDTIGIDCVAMNANDVLCVGAEPTAMLDYIAVEVPHEDLLGPIAQGLHAGAGMAGITIPGGEIAQVREMVHGPRKDFAFDLVGCCVGTVPLDKVLTGRGAGKGDVVVGLASTGVHSNGLSLARRVLLDRAGFRLGDLRPEIGRTLGEELLEPTRIYVREVLGMLRAGLRIKALAHITSTGFLNLLRGDSDVTYVLDRLPEPPPIFGLIQECGGVSDEEMFLTYNMGVGFCVVADAGDAEAIVGIARAHGVEASTIGYVAPSEERSVRIPGRGLTGRAGAFSKTG